MGATGPSSRATAFGAICTVPQLLRDMSLQHYHLQQVSDAPEGLPCQTRDPPVHSGRRISLPIRPEEEDLSVARQFGRRTESLENQSQGDLISTFHVFSASLFPLGFDATPLLPELFLPARWALKSPSFQKQNKSTLYHFPNEQVEAFNRFLMHC